MRSGDGTASDNKGPGLGVVWDERTPGLPREPALVRHPEPLDPELRLAELLIENARNHRSRDSGKKVRIIGALVTSN